ncbi:MAG: PEP-CTERM sorting domain-containing protein [Phycisphaerae bacterium]|nr:PEP-CTERM sorting domain-containing protein [Phycisphaerae bacterium]
MFKIMKYASVIVVILGLTGLANAAAVNIDTFDNGSLNHLLSAAGTNTQHEDITGGGVAGVTRLITVTAVGSGSGTIGYSINASLDGQASMYSAGSALTGIWLLRYGYTSGGGEDDLAIDLTGGGTNTGILFNIHSADSSYDLAVKLTDTDSNHTVTKNLSTNTSPHTVFFDFDDFTNIDETDVDQIDITLTGTTDGDYRFNLVSGNTPEPATMALLGVGSLALLFRRRRRSIKA